MGGNGEDARSSVEAGAGPLLRRDYWAAIASCRLRASDIGELLARRFSALASTESVQFTRRGAGDAGAPLDVGDELDVKIRFAGTFGVRVVHRNANSLTVATLRGHPEAGRITFGGYRAAGGEVIFHVRSHARASSRTRYAGFLTMGEPMQTDTWMDLIDRIAATIGNGVAGAIHEETRTIDTDEDENQPTFLARGD